MSIESKYNNVKYEIGQFVVRLLYHHSFFLPKMTDKVVALFFLYDLYDSDACIENPFSGVIYDIIVSHIIVWQSNESLLMIAYFSVSSEFVFVQIDYIVL